MQRTVIELLRELGPISRMDLEHEYLSRHGDPDFTSSALKTTLTKLRKQYRVECSNGRWSAKPTALGCNIFAGGFAAGVREHFDIQAHFEESNYFVRTFKHNFPHVPVWINTATWPHTRFHGKIDWVYCNPPCAPWSPAGATSRRGADAWRTDKRVDCVWNSFSLLDAIRPKVWCWESVPRAASPNGGRELVLELIERAKKLGYAATELFNAAWMHGIPQRRRRFMLFLHNIDLTFPPPEIEFVTLRDAIGGLTPDPDVFWLTEDKQELYNDTRPGDSLRSAWNRANPELADQKRAKGRPPWAEFRQHWDWLCGTVTSHNSQLHPDEPRYFALNELHKICGYPDDWEFVGSRGTWRTQMAQAVMPKVAEYVARCVRQSIDLDEPIEQLSHNVVDWTEGAKFPKEKPSGEDTDDDS